MVIDLKQPKNGELDETKSYFVLKCDVCGKFMSEYHYLTEGQSYFEPDNHFGPEIIEHYCGQCKKEENLN